MAHVAVDLGRLFSAAPRRWVVPSTRRASCVKACANTRRDSSQTSNVIRDDFNRLKVTLTNCVRLGPDSQNRSSHKHFSGTPGRCGCGDSQPGQVAPARHRTDSTAVMSPIRCIIVRICSPCALACSQPGFSPAAWLAFPRRRKRRRKSTST